MNIRKRVGSCSTFYEGNLAFFLSLFPDYLVFIDSPQKEKGMEAIFLLKHNLHPFYLIYIFFSSQFRNFLFFFI
jgi:hypothetical protein